jgi:hypothetical protein
MKDEDLLSSLRGHFSSGEAEGYDVLDFVYRYGSVLEALMFSRLFWPEFAEADGMVFFKEGVQDPKLRQRIRDYLERTGGDRAAVEQSFNLREVTIQLLGKDLKETTDEQIDWVEERLCEMWQARLSALYPDRRFKVELVNLDPDEPEGDTGITFYQIRGSSFSTNSR